MTKKEMARLINGRQVGCELSRDEAELAGGSGLVVIYGASDDLMEIQGAISDEVGCYNGGTAFFWDGEILAPECEDERCPHEIRRQENSKTVRAVWDEEGFSWTYKTNIPHETFEILELNEKFCRGIVFDIKEVI